MVVVVVVDVCDFGFHLPSLSISQPAFFNGFGTCVGDGDTFSGGLGAGDGRSIDRGGGGGGVDNPLSSFMLSSDVEGKGNAELLLELPLAADEDDEELLLDDGGLLLKNELELLLAGSAGFPVANSKNNSDNNPFT